MTDAESTAGINSFPPAGSQAPPLASRSPERPEFSSGPASSQASSPASKVTIVVVPRERFSVAPGALENLLDKTPDDIPIVYVDGNAPRSVASELQRLAGDRVELIRVDHYLAPNVARNIGFARAQTPYVAFLDNDAWVWDNWLPPLLACAEDTGAGAVGPLYLQGDRGTPEIHMAGGLAHIDVRHGKRYLKHNHYLQGQPLDDLPPTFDRRETEQIEFHGMLVDSALLRSIGGLDERLMCTREHIDLCMTIRNRGRTVYLEPSSRLTYTRPPPFALSDLRYFSLRWSEDWSTRTLNHFFTKWDLDRDQLPYLMTWVKKQRYRFLDPWYSRTTRWLARRFGEKRVLRVLRYTLYPLEGAVNRVANALAGAKR